MLDRLGYRVLTASDPVKALELAAAHQGKINLVLTDVIMPEMNGRELAGQIRELHPEVRFLFMSGYPADVISQQGVLDKGVQFIQKPFSMQDIAGKVKDILKSGKKGNHV